MTFDEDDDDDDYANENEMLKYSKISLWLD